MRKIEVGQRYTKVSSSSTVWQVLEPVLAPVGIHHFRIHNPNDPTTVRLISASALADDKIYRLINEH